MELAPLDFQPVLLRSKSSSGERVLLNCNPRLVNVRHFQLRVATMRTGEPAAAQHLLLEGSFVRADISLDGRLIFAVSDNHMYVWDTDQFIPRSTSDSLGVIRSVAMDGVSDQSVVINNNQVSLVYTETGKVVWSRNNDE